MCPVEPGPSAAHLGSGACVCVYLCGLREVFLSCITHFLLSSPLLPEATASRSLSTLSWLEAKFLSPLSHLAGALGTGTCRLWKPGTQSHALQSFVPLATLTSLAAPLSHLWALRALSWACGHLPLCCPCPTLAVVGSLSAPIVVNQGRLVTPRH